MSRPLAQLRRARWELLGVVAFAVFSLVLTSLVAGTLLKGGTPSSITVHAVFSDATGLRSGDDVRIAGVRVGKVTGIELDGNNARVTFVVDEKQPVYDRTIAKIDYLNLMGQRYVALSNPGGKRVGDGSTIPLERTREGLDLNALFNAFKPLFELIKPDDVNQLANNLVQVFQGQHGALQHLTDQTARITATIADRDEVIGAIIENMAAVTGELDDHHAEIGALVRELDTLTSAVAADRAQVGATIDGVAGLVTSFTDLVTDLRTTVDRDVRSLRAWAASFARQTPKIAGALKDVQLLLASYVKTLGLGSYLNTYVCRSEIQVGSAPPLELLQKGESSRRCR